ncbi:MAG: hypothetical protein HKP40_10730, partial [Litoreibacter sp.]|nr:hypothetical protein [Litoreibacter sp.]
WSTWRAESFASITVVLNATVVLMYWKIYLKDPALFYGTDGSPGAWHQEYFIHGLGPLLQMIDAFFILGVFRPIKRVLSGIVFVPVVYIFWIEALVQPMNIKPEGSVTTGLPYRFLNNMDLGGRGEFYVTTIGTMLALTAAAWFLAWLLRNRN